MRPRTITFSSKKNGDAAIHSRARRIAISFAKWLHFAMRPLLATMAAIMAIELVGGVLRLAMRAATSATHCGTTVTKVAGIILRPLFTKDSSGK